eukprot:103563_1
MTSHNNNGLDGLSTHNYNTTAWLCTTASQIFFMQLGFLCYEVGFVKPVWTQSVILKNIEDTFVGVLTFLAFGYSLSESTQSFHGIIAIPENPFLFGVDKYAHDQVLISAFFASTCATIISGAVLERMKNKAYITWCLLTILVNYSFISHWVWHPDGWLSQLDFVDGAGSVVVHTTAGMSAFVAIWKLGMRKESLDKQGNLKPRQLASKPIIHAVGAFLLWYGWFAFNISSPIAFSRGIGDALATTALITVISPIASSCSAFLWMHLNLVPLDFESLLNCLLAGLVSITGMCHTVNVHAALFIGSIASVVYFTMSTVLRNKWKIDDPLQVVTIHLFCGIYSGIAEGVVANHVYGAPGLLYGELRHFGVQVLGVTVIVVFNFIVSYFLWEVVLIRLIFRNEDVRVNILDVYLGTRLFDQNYDMALEEMLSCRSNAGKKMLFRFHQYIQDRYASEQLDFLVVTKVFMTYLQGDKVEFDAVQSAKYILKIIDTYVDNNGAQCINVSGTQRSILMKIRKQLWLVSAQKTPITKEEVQGSHKRRRSSSLIGYQAGSYKSGIDITKENVFEAAYKAIWRIVIPHFMNFLLHEYTMEKKHNFDVRIPFKLNKDWVIEWDDDLTKDSKRYSLLDTVPQHDGSLLRDYVNVDEQRPSTNTETQMAAAQANASVEIGEYPIVFVDDQTKKDHEHDAVVVIE